MDDVRAAFRAWEAARHAKNVPVCALRQPQLGVYLHVSPMFFISQNSSRLGVGPVYMHIFNGYFVFLCCPQKSFKFQMCIEANPCQSPRKCEHYH